MVNVKINYLPLRMRKRMVASNSVYSAKLLERTLKVSTDIANRQHRSAKENLIFRITQLVK